MPVFFSSPYGFSSNLGYGNVPSACPLPTFQPCNIAQLKRHVRCKELGSCKTNPTKQPLMSIDGLRYSCFHSCVWDSTYCTWLSEWLGSPFPSLQFLESKTTSPNSAWVCCYETGPCGCARRGLEDECCRDAEPLGTVKDWQGCFRWASPASWLGPFHGDLHIVAY